MPDGRRLTRELVDELERKLSLHPEIDRTIRLEATVTLHVPYERGDGSIAVRPVTVRVTKGMTL